MRFGASGRVVRILCGYVRCDTTHFAPFRRALPEFIHASTTAPGDWLAGIVTQIVHEVDAARGGRAAILERLTEFALLEVLRRQFLKETNAAGGWLSAIPGPVVGRCLRLIHDDQVRSWTLDELAHEAGASRSVVSDRFSTVLAEPPC